MMGVCVPLIRKAGRIGWWATYTFGGPEGDLGNFVAWRPTRRWAEKKAAKLARQKQRMLSLRRPSEWQVVPPHNDGYES